MNFRLYLSLHWEHDFSGRVADAVGLDLPKILAVDVPLIGKRQSLIKSSPELLVTTRVLVYVPLLGYTHESVRRSIGPGSTKLYDALSARNYPSACQGAGVYPAAGSDATYFLFLRPLVRQH